MLRRAYIEDRPSQLAIWARRTAFFALVAAALAVIVVRSGLLEIRPALATFAAALAIAGLSLLLAFAAFAVIWREGLSGMSYALWSIVLCALLLAYPGYLAVKAYQLPWLYDITTDPIDPPRYEALARVRPRDANPIAYAGLYAAEQQRDAYPEVEPLETDVSAQIAFEAAREVVNKRRWRVVDERAPQGPGRDGRIEAVARTAIMGFRDDVIVRIRADGEGARIDVRSSSRYGTHDLGANAARVSSLIDDIDEAIGERTPEQPVAQPAPQPERPKKRSSRRSQRPKR